MRSIREENFSCSCYSDEHELRFGYDPDENDIFVSVFLPDVPFFERVVNAIKYVFGYKCKYGHFECFLLRNVNDAKRLRLMLDDYIAGAKDHQLEDFPEDRGYYLKKL
jgi:hypothetical protein